MVQQRLFILESDVPPAVGIKLLHLGFDRLAEDLVDRFEFLFLLLDDLLGLQLGLVIVGRPCSLLDHPEQLGRLEMDDLSDLSLLHQEMRVLDVQLYTPEQILDFRQV